MYEFYVVFDISSRDQKKRDWRFDLHPKNKTKM